MARKLWNHTPALPLKTAPYWNWPMAPIRTVGHLMKSWKPYGTRFLFLAIACVLYLWFSPDLEVAKTLSVGWVSEILIRNIALITIVAGGLHVVLWAKKLQGDEYKYFLRPMATNVRAFFFRDQVLDNILWSLVAVTFMTFWECLMWYAYANGIAPMITFEAAPIWFLVLIVLIPIEAGFHFYFFHRLLHVGKLYTWVHSWHHKNIQTGPWSGLAMHPAESFFLRADILWFFLIPAHPIHVLFLIMHSTIGAPTSHTGFERVKVGKSKGLEVGDFFHQLHHRFFDCNYGTDETPWDEWFGTFHDGTDAGNELIKERRSKIWLNPS